MKKFKKVLKQITLMGLVVYACVLGYKFLFTTPTTVEYVKPVEVIEEVIKAPETNDVEEAQRMLAEATAKLNAEEATLTEEIAAIKAEAEAEVAEREAKIAEINEIRASF